MIGCIRIGLAQYTHAELYKTDMENISSNSFLSALGSALRKSFHSANSILLAIRNEGMKQIGEINEYHSVSGMYRTSLKYMIRGCGKNYYIGRVP